MEKIKSSRISVRRSEPLRLTMHHKTPSHDHYRSWMCESDRPLAIDLFSGAGGLSHGLEAAGYRVALAVDIDNWALETHAHNFEGISLNLDLADSHVRDGIVQLFEGIDVGLIAGGPPCQPYSKAGRSKIRSLVNQGVRDPEDLRRDLWKAFLEIVDSIHPQAILMENVPDMASADDMKVLRHIVIKLEAMGYDAYARIVNTWEYGVPQHRQRLIIVGTRIGSQFVWPSTVDQVNVRDAIGDLPHLDPKREEVGGAILPYDKPSNSFQRRARKYCEGDSSKLIFDHVTRPVRPDDLEAFSLMTSKTLYSDLPEKLRRYRSDIFSDKYHRLDWGGLSRSITAHIAKDGYWYIHPEQHRTLTVREAARIQTFPDHFRFAGTRSHQFSQIGNAVPPVIAEAIGGEILKATYMPTEDQNESPNLWRSSVRSSLLQWAKCDQMTVKWAYPSPPWEVLVGLIFGEKDKGLPDCTTTLDLISSLNDATVKKLRRLEIMANSTQRRATIQRLQMAVKALNADKDGWSGHNWRKAVTFTSTEWKWFNLLALNEDAMVLSSSALRVVSRLNGDNNNEKNRMSVGRMELAMIIGHGDSAATVNAAIHRLGCSVCLPKEPKCSSCPLKLLCKMSPR